MLCSGRYGAEVSRLDNEIGAYRRCRDSDVRSEYSMEVLEE